MSGLDDHVGKLSGIVSFKASYDPGSGLLMSRIRRAVQVKTVQKVQGF